MVVNQVTSTSQIGKCMTPQHSCSSALSLRDAPLGRKDIRTSPPMHPSLPLPPTLLQAHHRLQLGCRAPHMESGIMTAACRAGGNEIRFGCTVTLIALQRLQARSHRSEGDIDKSKYPVRFVSYRIKTNRRKGEESILCSVYAERRLFGKHQVARSSDSSCNRDDAVRSLVSANGYPRYPSELQTFSPSPSPWSVVRGPWIDPSTAEQPHLTSPHLTCRPSPWMNVYPAFPLLRFHLLF
jgi:hypothetical protein